MKDEINQNFGNFVVKSNSLIEARYRLSLQESQIILWLLTQIKPSDEDFKSHKLDIVEFAKITQVAVESKYTELRKITKRLMQRVMEIHKPETEQILQVSWLSSALYQPKKGFVLLEFSPQLRPYLLQLKSHFTKIDVIDTLKLKSIYAVRVFELLLQYVSIGRRKISVENLRAYCGIQQTKYKNYFDLKCKMIEKAKIEINSKTEYTIDYTEIKESRKIVAVEWTIKKKNVKTEAQCKKRTIIEKEFRFEKIVIDALMEYGVSRQMAKQLIKNHSEDVVKDSIRVVNLQIERNHAKNPKALLLASIKNKWDPEKFVAHKK